MRPAVSRIVELYTTSPVFQDLLETAAYTGVSAAGQAAFTDMTPEQIALASAGGFGAGLIGRPIVGRAGQAIGGVLDRHNPVAGKALIDSVNETINTMPKPVRDMYRAKMGPYENLGGAAQYGNLLGRTYGDNLAQLAVTLAAPGIFGEQEQ